jgi:hypothetical protein
VLIFGGAQSANVGPILATRGTDRRVHLSADWIIRAFVNFIH